MINYRPISILPFFSTILNRLMYNRLLNYVSLHTILVANQFVFREAHSTSVAVIRMVNDISNEIDNNIYSVDLSKAFDMVNHKILLQKLFHYGNRGIILEWFDDYLTNRTQYVSIMNTYSKIQSIQCGAPQGSILGPRLFILFTNDIINTSPITEFITFANDTNFFF